MQSPAIEALKRQAAEAAVSQIRSGMVVGLGTGSTVRYALEALAYKIQTGRPTNISGIPSSIRTERLARSLAIPLTTFKEHPVIDVTIDGADEVDPDLNLIKGAGGALLREKVLAQASRTNLIIVDAGKLSQRLGTHHKLPIEVIPFALDAEIAHLMTRAASVTIRLKSDGTPYRSDQDNFILDADFGPISDPYQLQLELDGRAGIAAHGLFLDLADQVIIAGEAGLQTMRRGTDGDGSVDR